MKIYAVVGNPIEHSLSPDIHTSFAKQTGIELRYEKRLIKDFTIALPSLSKQYFGINVTLPFKFDAAKACDRYGDGLAGTDSSRSHAVNTIAFRADKIIGYNTDGIGLIRDLKFKGHCVKDKTLLILGAGGACAGILPAILREKPKQVYLANRSVEKAIQLATNENKITAISLSELQHLASPDLIINATSAGMTGKVIALPPTLFNNLDFAYDLSYSLDSTTPFIAFMMANGVSCTDGYGMLIEQARESFRIWHKTFPNRCD